MKQTLIAIAILFSAFTINAQVSKQDSARIDSAIAKILVKQLDEIGKQLSSSNAVDRLNADQWNAVMNLIDRKLGEAILELRKRIRQ